jgi:hypothetical protein
MAPLAVVLLAVGARPGDFLAPPALDRWLAALGMLARGRGARDPGARHRDQPDSAERRPAGSRRRLRQRSHGWCRNRSVANTTILIGFTMIFDSRWMVGLALPGAPGIRSIVAAEGVCCAQLR